MGNKNNPRSNHVSEDEARKAAEARIHEVVRDSTIRERCLKELQEATPIEMDNGLRFVIPSLVGYDERIGTISVIDRGFFHIEPVSENDPVWDKILGIEE